MRTEQAMLPILLLRQLVVCNTTLLLDVTVIFSYLVLVPWCTDCQIAQTVTSSIHMLMYRQSGMYQRPIQQVYWNWACVKNKLTDDCFAFFIIWWLVKDDSLDRDPT
jgi:hypothetical protein